MPTKKSTDQSKDPKAESKDQAPKVEAKDQKVQEPKEEIRTLDPRNSADVELMTKDNYQPDVKEEDLYHLKLEKKSFDKNTGQKLSKPYVQKMGVREYANFKQHSTAIGFSHEVLWDPTESQEDF